MATEEHVFRTRNRTCRRCKTVVPIGAVCKKPVNTQAGVAYYNYCTECHRSVGADPLGRVIALRYANESSMPTVVNVSAAARLLQMTLPEMDSDLDAIHTSPWTVKR